MTASYIIKTKAAGRGSYLYGQGRPQPRHQWHTLDTASTLTVAKLIAAQRGIRSGSGRAAAVFYRGRIVARLAVALAAGILAAGCAPLGSTEPWTVRQDPNGLGYWAGPDGEPERFYPSAYSNPILNTAGGPDR